MSSPLISRDITFDVDNVILKQNFWNESDDGSRNVGFEMSKRSFSIEFVWE
jgi:hypothetical protein